MATTSIEEDKGEILALVLDTSFANDLQPSVIHTCLDAITVFCNSHLIMSSNNQLVVVGCHANKSMFLYPTKASTETNNPPRPLDGQYELLTSVSTSLSTNIKSLMASCRGVYTTEPLLTGGISLALCYVNQKMNRTDRLKGRICIVSSSGESAHQYLNFMNVFFAAQRKQIMLDACVLEKDSGLLQQGCDITGGIYLKVPNPSALLEYLLWVFLPNKESREKLVLPKCSNVDYRTACFCHRTLIEIGYVCSVCLSIFCSYSPICSTCQTHFKFMGALPSMIKKKRKVKE